MRFSALPVPAQIPLPIPYTLEAEGSNVEWLVLFYQLTPYGVSAQSQINDLVKVAFSIDLTSRVH
jgi:hypothetical protein